MPARHPANMQRRNIQEHVDTHIIRFPTHHFIDSNTALCSFDTWYQKGPHPRFHKSLSLKSSLVPCQTTLNQQHTGEESGSHPGLLRYVRHNSRVAQGRFDPSTDSPSPVSPDTPRCQDTSYIHEIMLGVPRYFRSRPNMPIATITNRKTLQVH